MVKYLNKRNKDYVMYLVLLVEHIDGMIESLKLEGIDRKRLKTAKTYMYNVYRAIIESLDRNQQEALLRTAKHNRIAFVPERGNFTETEVEQSRDILYDIVEGALEGKCVDCQEGAIVEDCALRQAMLQYQIPVYEEVCDEGRCPYKQRR